MMRQLPYGANELNLKGMHELKCAISNRVLCGGTLGENLSYYSNSSSANLHRLVGCPELSLFSSLRVPIEQFYTTICKIDK